MGAGERLWLDELERAAERVRRALGVSTLSVSRFAPRARSLHTLLNAGALGPGEERRPAAERYPLREFPAAAALVTRRRPYVSSPGTPGDEASLAIEAALDKSSQAAAPLVIGDAVWGELWVASAADDLPLDRGELPLIRWTAERFAGDLDELLGDLAPAFTDAADGRHRYHVWLAGTLDEQLVLALTGAQARAVGRFTVVAGDFESDEVCELISRLANVGLAIVGVGRDDTPVRLPSERRPPERGYEIRFARPLAASLFEDRFDVTVGYEGLCTLVSADVDRAALGRLMRHAKLMNAELVAVTCCAEA